MPASPMRTIAVSSLLLSCLVQTGASQAGTHRVLSADRGWMAAGKRLLRGMPIGNQDRLTADAAGDLMLQCSGQCPTQTCSAATSGRCAR